MPVSYRKGTGIFFMSKLSGGGDSRYFLAVTYPENMIEGWEEECGDILGIPYAYCVHDKDHLAEYKPKQKETKERMRKVHVHWILVFTNTTTYNHALTIINKLSIDGKRCCNKVEVPADIRNSYEYLIHNTKAAKNQKKFRYDESDRILGNNFDIGSYEQLSLADKKKIRSELIAVIRENGFFNFADFYDFVMDNFDDKYLDVIASNNCFFDRYLNGMYQRMIRET